MRWAERTGDALHIARMHQALSVCDAQRGRLDSAIAHGRAWGDAARAADDPRIRATANWPLLNPLLSRGDIAELRRVAQLQLGLTRDHPDAGMREWGISARAEAALSVADAEQYDGSLARARELYLGVLESARRIEQPEWEIVACQRLAQVGLASGDRELATTGLQRCTELAERLGRMSRLGAAAQLGICLMLDGKFEAARDALDAAFDTDKDRFDAWQPNGVLLVSALLGCGDVERAERLAETSLARCLEIGARTPAMAEALALSRVLRARAGVAAGERIEELLRLVERLIAETGARNLSPCVALERAELCGLRGDAEGRVAQLREARAGFARMEAASRVREMDRALDAASR
jgi:tetratricopeptide (TPR) repeat protein